MKSGRLTVVAAREWRAQVTGPLFWALVALSAAAVATMNPTAMIPDSSSTPLIINSRLALAQGFALTSFFLYNFFAALMAGLTVIRDEERRVGELIHATPLTGGEYVAGKFVGVAGALLVAVAAHAVIVMAFVQLVPGWNPEAARGAFRPANYLLPALVFALPGALFSAGAAFWVGERSRQPLLVFAVPTVIFLVTVFVFNALPLRGLDPALETLLAVADPSGLRWLRQSFFAVDRGAAFYNAAPLGLDALFWLGRLATVGVPLLLVAWSMRRFRTSVAASGRRPFRWRRRREEGPDQVARRAFAPLSASSMSSTPPGRVTGALAVARAEMAELRAQPAIAVYLLLVLAMVLEFAGSAGVAGAPLLLTAGALATGTLPVITFLLCLLLLFAGVEPLTREERCGADALVHATPVATSALVIGKTLALAALAALAVLASGALSVMILALQPGAPPVAIRPFLLVWGALMGPSLALWIAFVAATVAMTRNRLASLAAGLLVLVVSGYSALTGAATWPVDWTLAGALRWSDLGAFELYREPLVLNRLLAATTALLLLAVAVRFYPRREADPEAARERRRPAALARRLRWLAPWAAAPLLLALALQLGSTENADRDRRYRGENLDAWGDAATPGVVHMDLAIELRPAERRAEVLGSYLLRNDTGEALDRLAFTVGADIEDLRWSAARTAIAHHDRSGLHVLDLPSALAAGDELEVGFAFGAVVPSGWARRGGGAEQFILPGGVVLHTLRDGFLPVPGFDETIGRPDGEGATPREGDPRRPAVGPVLPFTTRIVVTAPAAYTVNSVGALVSRETRDGRTTVVWESAVPVRAINVVAGRWDVARRDGAAVFHHPGHDWNVEEMLDALVAARRWYGEWFGPYPWPELRLSEFPDLATLAQGFPSNITFSEGVGFLARPGQEPSLPFAVTAHEAAHQWWGNLLNPADTAGADVLIEGMANYATLLLHGKAKGEEARIAFARQLEERYLDGRRIDAERPLTDTVDDGSPGYDTVVFDKAAWALWMLHDHLGEQRMLAGLRDFHGRYRALDPLAFATLDDLLASLRPLAPDPAAYDDLVDQWFRRVVLPEFDLRDIAVDEREGRHEVDATIENVGTGTVAVEVAVVGDDRRELATVRLAPGEPRRLRWSVDFAPRRIVFDPDARVLQRGRVDHPLP